MKLDRIASTLVAAVVLISAGTAMAANQPLLKAKKYQSSLVRAYQECTTPNTNHNPPLGLTACSPSVPTASVLNLNPTKGFGTVTVTVKSGPDIKLAAKIKGVRMGTTAYSGNVTITAGIRVTDTNCVVAGDCTQSDLAIGIYNVQITCTNGTCAGSDTLNNTVIAGLVVAGKQANVELKGLEVRGPDNVTFLVPGLYIP